MRFAIANRDAKGTKPLIGLFGGTFDPVHLGHVALGKWLYETGAFAAIHYVVNAVPPHRPLPAASSAQRVKMLKLALADCSGLYVDDRELRRSGISYTLETLAAVREEVGQRQPLALILGEDAFATLRSWQGWEKIPTLVHLVLMRRMLPADGEHTVDVEREVAAVIAALALPQVLEPGGFMDAPAGMLWYARQPLTPEAATPIRTKILASGEAQIELTDELSPSVAAYIKAEGLYQT